MLARLRRTRTATRVVVAVAAVALVGGGGYWFVLRDDAAAAETPDGATQTVAASLTTLEKSVSGSGTLTPTVQEDVSFDASGTVTAVDVVAGQTVTAGQTLATIDTLVLDADLLTAKATLATAQARLAESEDDDDGSDAAEAQIAADAAQVEVAQAQVDAAAQTLAGATLVAPVDGLLTEVNLTVGQAVTGGSTGAGPDASDASTAHVVIVGTDSWEIDITVDDSEVALIATGDQAEITVEDVADPIFGVVTEIGLISTSTGGVAGYPVSVEVTGSPEGVHDGIAADVSVVYERRTDVLTVPSAAVRTVDGESVVTQLGEDGTEVTTPVTVGETVGELTEIVSGLAEGDEVVVTVVTRSEQSGTGTEQAPGSFQMPEGFDPSQMQLPDGAVPRQGGRVDE